MNFQDHFRQFSPASQYRRSLMTPRTRAEMVLERQSVSAADFPELISPSMGEFLETLCQRSHQLTRQRFGNVIRLFAPLYLSSECINVCRYCGFSRTNAITRVTLSPEEVETEGLALHDQGFRSILLVAGEHPKFVPVNYLAECVERLRPLFPSIALEVAPLTTDEYGPLVWSGAEGLVVYQETYDLETYREMHTAGPKRDFWWRLGTPERAYAAGFKRLGIGALLGLADWRSEALALAAHCEFLLRHCWKAAISVSFPRLRPCAGESKPAHPISDQELTQLIAAFRLAFPDVHLVLSTREPAWLRNGLLNLGITMASAGSHTEPGGYTGVGKPRAANGPEAGENHWPEQATPQFQIADERSPAEVAAVIQALGCEPVWKDWDAALCRESGRHDPEVVNT